MGRLSDHKFHILSIVAKHERICIGLPVSGEWSPIAKTLAKLARPNPGMLLEEHTDDGPAYLLTVAGIEKVSER